MGTLDLMNELGLLPLPGPWETLADIADANRSIGHYWFTEGAVAFFITAIETGVEMGRFFVTSERMDEDEPKRFTVRAATNDGRIITVGDFHAYDTRQQALDAIARLTSFDPIEDRWGSRSSVPAPARALRNATRWWSAGRSHRPLERPIVGPRLRPLAHKRDHSPRCEPPPIVTT